MPSMLDVKITHCIQDSQEFGSTDDHMVSRVFMRLTLNGEGQGETYSTIKQAVGDPSFIEVTSPVGYNGPFDHQEFTSKLTDYFNGLSMINVGRSVNVRMLNNLHVKPLTFTLIRLNAGPSWNHRKASTTASYLLFRQLRRAAIPPTP